MTKIINGKEISKNIKEKIKLQVSEFENLYHKKVTLSVVLIGENSASKIYVKNKIKTAEALGIKSLSYFLPENSNEKDVEELILNLAQDNDIDGILVQLPLPKNIDEQKILSLIPVAKDVDGFSSQNLGNLLLGNKCTYSCTPIGVIKMLESVNYDFESKNAVIIGRSNIVGKPLALLLLQKNCTVTICHSKTKDIKNICKKADLIITALGKPKFLKADMVKRGVCIIDVGINRTEEGLCGDVDFENVSKKAEYISPVPGGVGPMTIAMLMQNAYYCALNRIKNE